MALEINKHIVKSMLFEAQDYTSIYGTNSWTVLQSSNQNFISVAIGSAYQLIDIVTADNSKMFNSLSLIILIK